MRRATAGLRETLRVGAGGKRVQAEEEAAEGAGASQLSTCGPGRLPSPNLRPDGSAEWKSFAPRPPKKKSNKRYSMPINVLFPPSPANPTSTPPSGCLLMSSSLSFPTQLVWRAPPLPCRSDVPGEALLCPGLKGRCGETGETRDNARRADKL